MKIVIVLCVGTWGLAALAWSAVPVVQAQDAPESLLAGTRWMSIGAVARLEDVPLERMVVIRMCAIADMAFTMVDGRLTKFDRASLAGRSEPRRYAKVEAGPGAGGGTFLTLHGADDANDPIEEYVLDAAGTILRLKINGGDGNGFVKCAMGTPRAISLPTPAAAP